MNRLDALVLPVSVASCLLLLGHGFLLGAQDAGEVVELGKLKSRVPTTWVQEDPYKPSYYRQYRLEPIGDDKDNACVIIEPVGKGSGESAEKQVEHWKTMFLPRNGKKLEDVVKVRKVPVSGVAVTYVDVRGDYKGIPGDFATPRENYRLLGVYFPVPEKPYLIRLFGPADTVAFYRKGFEDWVTAFK